MKGHIIEKATGKRVYYGHVENKSCLHDDMHEILLSGNVPTPPEQKTGQDLLWTGTEWKLGPEPKPPEKPKVNLSSPTLVADLVQILEKAGILQVEE